MKRRLQNKIAESTWTLPVAAVFVALWWLLPFAKRWQEPIGLAVCLFTTYVLMEMNSTNALLRVRSRMISTLFLMLVTAMAWLHPFNWACVAVACMALSFNHLFLSYGARDAVVPTFHTHLFVSLASFVWPPLLWLSPVQWWNQAVFLRSMSWRCCWAAFFGLFLPYFFWGVWELLTFSLGPELVPAPPVALVTQANGIIAPFVGPVLAIMAGEIPLADVWLNLNQELVDADRDVRVVFTAHQPWLMAHLYQLAATAFILLLGLTGFVHYLRKNYDDRISVRMCHYSFLLMAVVIVLWLLLSPTSWPQLFPLLILVVSPSVAHFFSLTRTWLTNAWFVLCILLWVLLLAYPYISVLIPDP